MADEVLLGLQSFADAVSANFDVAAPGEPEAQLSAPLVSLFESLQGAFGRKLLAKPESRLPGRLGVPDFGVLVDSLLSGYIETKAPRKGADTSAYRGADRQQWERFSAQPNILYTDGNEWCLYRNGEAVGTLLRFQKDICRHGQKAISKEDALHFQSIVFNFLNWKPIVPTGAQDLAEFLAPLCRLLRNDVAEALNYPESPLVQLAMNWRKLLFPDATDDRFADAYAQTVTFAMLLARSEGAAVHNLSNTVDALEARHSLLCKALQVLTDMKARREINSSLLLLQRVIDALPPSSLETGEQDPWLYFYEHFLAAYDPKLRKDAGAYYTPVEVVKCQVALIDDLLRKELGKKGGFANKDVITLDPAVGTGTYLLGVIDKALSVVAKEEGKGSVPAHASRLAANLHGFEVMVGPYAVAELRLSRALLEHHASLPEDGLGVYLTDTLESPHATPPQGEFFTRELSDQHTKALEVEERKAVIVCLGNPPYDRHQAVGEEDDASRARTGGWVRWGSHPQPTPPILDDFIKPVRQAGHAADLKNLYNLYVYFWRWGLWKVFEHQSSSGLGGAGIVSFITAGSYLRGDAFRGMREVMRRQCDDIWILDLGGEGRGTRKDENVFSIQTPVAICVALRRQKKASVGAATVRYHCIRGSRSEKLAAVGTMERVSDVSWKLCPSEWQAPFRPRGSGPFFTWPLLNDLMPWWASGMETKRPWVYSHSTEVLQKRWKRLLSGDRTRLFHETRDRKVAIQYPAIAGFDSRTTQYRAIDRLSAGEEFSGTRRIAYRSLDRHWIIADNRLADYPRPALWASWSNTQLFFTTLSTQALGEGPGLMVAADVPDRHHFRGSYGGKDVVPLYRDAGAAAANLLPGLLSVWGKGLRRKVTAEEFACYLYALLGHPGYVDRFYEELEDREARVPLTLSSRHYDQAVAAGRRLLFLHTYGERCDGKHLRRREIPRGQARCTEPISDRPGDVPEQFQYDRATCTLTVGKGLLKPIAPAVWDYSVSGLRVVDSWLGHRMKRRSGRKSSPLDEICASRWTADDTEELLGLLWILEATIDTHPLLKKLLDGVCSGPLLLASSLPAVPEGMRKPPALTTSGELFPVEVLEDGDEVDDEGVA